MSKKIKMKLEKTLPDWKIYDCQERGGCYEIENRSPAGENIIITLRGASLAALAKDIEEAYIDFDPDEHAAQIYSAKFGNNENERRFYADAPATLRELLDDAKAIEAMYKHVWEKIYNAA